MDRDYLVDLALSIAQDCAEEWHGKEIISGMEKELETIDKKEMPALHERLSQEIDDQYLDWLDGVDLRRFKMDVLGIKSPAYDYHRRCKLKHRATAFVQAVETYQSDPDELTLKAMQWSEKRYWKALCEFMGVKEITDCGRCLSDQLNNLHTKESFAEKGIIMDTPKEQEKV